MAAGTINTVVGSGSLLTFPTLLALGYRRELTGQRHRLTRLVPASVIGALAGALLLLALPSSVFERVVIVLILIALVLVLLGPRLSRRLARPHDAHTGLAPVLVILVGLAGVYGGYFGAAQGIILIAVLGIFVLDDLQRLNGAKNVLAMTVNLVASVVFVFATNVDWAVVTCIA